MARDIAIATSSVVSIVSTVTIDVVISIPISVAIAISVAMTVAVAVVPVSTTPAVEATSRVPVAVLGVVRALHSDQIDFLVVFKDLGKLVYFWGVEIATYFQCVLAVAVLYEDNRAVVSLLAVRAFTRSNCQCLVGAQIGQ